MATTTTTGIVSDSPAPEHSTGIKVIVVGLGLGGLTAAIECHRKGHSVIALEKNSDLKRMGRYCLSKLDRECRGC